MQMSKVPIISGYEEDIIYEYIYYIKKLLKIIIVFFTLNNLLSFSNLYNLDHPNLFIWMMSNDDPVFLSAFIEYLNNNFLSRKGKKII
jgi:hypothetical protein